MSAATLINYLNHFIPGYTQQLITYRLHNGKEHGIIIETVPKDVGLVIVPDAGSNDYEAHKRLKALGIDVLVLDHHEAEYVSPYACVINNQLSPSYPNKTLSGVGVVYKFCQYLDVLLNQHYANDLLDLVAVGLVSDMMDLRSFETRELISLGISQIKNSFLNKFVDMQSYSLKGELTPFGIAFYIAPYINATIRVGTFDEKLLLFESLLDFRANELIPSTKRGYKGQFETRIEQACRNCKNIKNRQTKARDTSLAKIEDIITQQQLLKHPVLIIQLETPIEENLTGLIANQIMGKYKQPILLLHKHTDSNGHIVWRGSGRNSTYSKLTNFREFLAKSGLVEYAQGHASAFGISILNSNLTKLKQYIDKELSNLDTSRCYRVDFIWDSHNINEHINDILSIGQLSPYWGQGLPEPQIAIEGIVVHRDNLVLMSPDKNPTLKITLPGISLIKFSSGWYEYNSLKPDIGCSTWNIVGTCNVNDWNGNLIPQIIIQDYEVTNSTLVYF